MMLYTEIDPYCCAVLRARVADGGLPPGDVWERDIRTITAEELAPFRHVHLFCGIGGSPLGLRWAGWPDELSIVTGGFPCQDISVAGKGAGIEGERSGLWKEMHRVINIVRPDWIIAENVPALRTRGIDRVLGDMESLGYEATALVVGADDVGAPHRRKRVWIVGRCVGNTSGAASERDTGGLPAAQAGERGPRQHDGDCAERPEHAGAGDELGNVADSERSGRGAGAGVGGDEGRAGSGRREPARSGGLADTAGGGCGADGRARGGDGHADEPCAFCGYRFDHIALGKYGCPNCEGDGVEHALGTGREEPHAPAFADQSRLRGWPVAPGVAQHGWEAPRLVRFPQRGVGAAVDGLSGRLARFANKHALHALGNSQVPQVVEVVARAIIAAQHERHHHV